MIYNIFVILLIMMAICQTNLVLPFKEYESYFGVLPIFSVQILSISLIYANKKFLFPDYKSYRCRFINYYLCYIYTITFAGLFYASNYVEYRQLVVGFISLNVPILIWLFYEPGVFLNIMSGWYKWAWLPFFPLFFFKLGFVETYWEPILILLCLFPLYKKPYMFVILLFAVLFTFADIEEDRAPFIKGSVAFLTGIGIGLRNRISNALIRMVHVLSYLSVFFLFIYIFSDFFSVISGSSIAEDVVSNNRFREKAHKDTRSLLYLDVLTSSIDQGYFLFGHTPARGFEVQYSGGLFMSDDVVLNKGERHKNEMVLSNIFTWGGLVGLILFSMIYFYGTYLAVYCSKNRIIPFIGCFIAWRWAWGWVQDVNNFLCTDIDLWALMAICYSSYFRKMNDVEFKLWARGLLSTQCRRKFFNVYSLKKYAE